MIREVQRSGKLAVIRRIPPNVDRTVAQIHRSAFRLVFATPSSLNQASKGSLDPQQCAVFVLQSDDVRDFASRLFDLRL